MARDLGRGRERYDIFEITLTDNARSVADALRRRGYAGTAKSIQEKVDRRALRVMTEITKAGLDAVRETIPIDTGELAYEHVEMVLPTKGHPVGQIYVDTEPHFGRKADPVVASSLADILNTTDFRRSVDGSTTKNWVGDAAKVFKKMRREAIKRAFQ
jgi:hypothetical protein